MKIITRITIAVTASLMAAMLASCSTTKKAEAQSADTYTDAAASAAQDQGTAAAAPKTETKKKGIFSKDADPIELGHSSVFLYNALNTDVNQNDVYYYYYPSSSEICMRLTGIAVKSDVFFNRKMCSMIRQTADQYLKDFDAHLLDKTAKNTYQIYGETTGSFKWGLLGATNKAKPKTSIGYKFVKNSPYFVLTFWPTKADTVEVPAADVPDFDKTTILMTKKQLADLVTYMSEEKLDALAASAQNEVQKGDAY